jgi:hypothetical protein
VLSYYLSEAVLVCLMTFFHLGHMIVATESFRSRSRLRVSASGRLIVYAPSPVSRSGSLAFALAVAVSLSDRVENACSTTARGGLERDAFQRRPQRLRQEHSRAFPGGVGHTLLGWSHNLEITDLPRRRATASIGRVVEEILRDEGS